VIILIKYATSWVWCKNQSATVKIEVPAADELQRLTNIGDKKPTSKQEKRFVDWLRWFCASNATCLLQFHRSLLQTSFIDLYILISSFWHVIMWIGLNYKLSWLLKALK
jgi:hypothetical protein